MNDIKYNLIKNLNEVKLNLLSENTIDNSLNRIIEYYIENLSNNVLSENQIINLIKINKNDYKYSDNINKIFESIYNEAEENKLIYDLSDLYHSLNKTHDRHYYSSVLNKILEIINTDSSDYRKVLIANDLAIWNFIPEVRSFLLKYTDNPYKQEEILSDLGLSEEIITIYQKINEGDLIYIKNSWFLITEEKVKKIPFITDIVKDQHLLNKLTLLEKSIQLSKIKENILSIEIDEDIILSISLDENKSLFINKEISKANLNIIFESPLIPENKKDLYSIFESVSLYYEQFVKYDKCIKIYNAIREKEGYAFIHNKFNYLYEYNKLSNNGILYEYKDINKLIENVKIHYGINLSTFFNSNISNNNEMNEKYNINKYNKKLKRLKKSLKELRENKSKIIINKGMQIKYNKVETELLNEIKKISKIVKKV